MSALLCLTLFAACGNDSATETDKPENLTEKFAPYINGSWIMTDYVHNLATTKSPKASSEKLKDVVYMSINTAEMDGDTIIVSSSLNNHEGYTFYLFMRKGQNEQSLQTEHTDETGDGFYELSYEVNNNDTMLYLNHYSAGKQFIGKKSFSKITGAQSENGQPYNVAYVANKVLFSGNYTVTDSEGKTSKANFTDDGLVTGIGGHKTYYIFTDFIGDDETNLDELLFDEHTMSQKGYIFEISGDTTRLYKASENEERTLLIKGPLTYTLVRE